MKHRLESLMQSDTQGILDAIRRIVKSLRRASKLSEKKMGLSSAQLFVLQKIAESDSPLSVNDLAARTLTHQSSVSVVVKKLEKKMLIERQPSESDARAVELRICKKGTLLLRGAPPLIQKQLMDGITLLSKSERQGLVIGLRALIEKAGLQEEEPSLFFEDSKG